MEYGLCLVAKPEMPASIRLSGVSVSDIFTSIEHCFESDYNRSVSSKNLTKSKQNNACRSSVLPQEDGLFVIGSTFSAANGDIEEK